MVATGTHRDFSPGEKIRLPPFQAVMPGSSYSPVEMPGQSCYVRSIGLESELHDRRRLSFDYRFSFIRLSLFRRAGPPILPDQSVSASDGWLVSARMRNLEFILYLLTGDGSYSCHYSVRNPMVPLISRAAVVRQWSRFGTLAYLRRGFTLRLLRKSGLMRRLALAWRGITGNALNGMHALEVP